MKKNNLYMKYLLWEAKIKQKDIASQAGCSQQLVSQYLSGYNNSKVVKSTIKKLLESSPDYATLCFHDEIKNISSSSSSSSSSRNNNIKDKKLEAITDFEHNQHNIRDNVSDDLLIKTWKDINNIVKDAGYTPTGRKKDILKQLHIILCKHDWTIILKVLEFAFHNSWWKTKIRDTDFIINNYIEIWKQMKMATAGILPESEIKNICDVRE